MHQIVMAKTILPKIRILAGLDKNEMADFVGITNQSYGRIENRKNGATPENAKRICDVLKKPFDELFTIQIRKTV